MNGDIIPDQDHIARYCNPNHVDNEQILPSAFFLDRDENDLSVNWLEYLNCNNRIDEIEELRRVYEEKVWE